jgi:hypothetical protein
MMKKEFPFCRTFQIRPSQWSFAITSPGMRSSATLSCPDFSSASPSGTLDSTSMSRYTGQIARLTPYRSARFWMSVTEDQLSHSTPPSIPETSSWTFPPPVVSGTSLKSFPYAKVAGMAAFLFRANIISWPEANSNGAWLGGARGETTDGTDEEGRVPGE